MAEKKRSSPAKKLRFGSSARTATSQIHAKVDRDSDDNAGVDAANRGSQIAEAAGDYGSSAASRYHQKKAIKKEYAAAKAGKTTGNAAAEATAAGNAKEAEKAVKESKSAVDLVTEFITDHGKTILAGGCLLMIILMITGAFGSCTAFLDGSVNAVLVTSYTADDADILGAEADYCALEAGLQNRVNNIQTTHPGYDEYNIDSDQIGHNPYELASYLTVLFENYTREDVQSTLQQIFNSQYSLSINSVTETRYRTETRTKTKTVTKTVTDPETGETHEIEVEKEIEYEVEIPYEYKILNVTLNNNGLSGILTSGNLLEDQLFRYGVLMETLGNRSDLFEDNIYAVASQEVLHYDIPGEALTDDKFRRMITEAEKYLGYPYVWGGSSPSTSFDCSGFVSWVINHCGNGWSVGRKTANGLKNICTIIQRSEARPGDLIFFQGTYDTAGASHVGIYVGNGMMIHCGNPIQYASINTSYWQAHFYCFGRLP